MSQTNTNQKGFTIVELLIVIVVIAILAAISIVAYTGIQSRAKTSANQSLASQVEKKAQAYYTIESVYPMNQAAFGSGPDEAQLEGNVTMKAVTSTTGTGIVSTDENTVGYAACDDGAIETTAQAEVTGMVIAYYDYTIPGIKVKVIGDCTT